MIIDNISQCPDGSAWTALVYVRGVLFRCSYVANQLSVTLGPYKHHPRRPRWYQESVQAWAEKQVAALSPEWLAMHREMYAGV